MQWTSDAPTEAGFYWLKGYFYDGPTIVEVSGDTLMLIGQDETYSIREETENLRRIATLEWCGPILPPS